MQKHMLSAVLWWDYDCPAWLLSKETDIDILIKLHLTVLAHGPFADRLMVDWKTLVGITNRIAKVGYAAFVLSALVRKN